MTNFYILTKKIFEKNFNLSEILEKQSVDANMQL